MKPKEIARKLIVVEEVEPVEDHPDCKYQVLLVLGPRLRIRMLPSAMERVDADFYAGRWHETTAAAIRREGRRGQEEGVGSRVAKRLIRAHKETGMAARLARHLIYFLIPQDEQHSGITPIWVASADEDPQGRRIRATALRWTRKMAGLIDAWQ